MAIDFRCEHCGKLLSVEAGPSSRIKCPYCKAKVTVPAGLASLPRPQVPGGGEVQAAAPPAPEDEIAAPAEQDALMGVMATLMPWVISLFFHAGVLVILAFITIVMFKETTKADITAPVMQQSKVLGESINPGKDNPELRARSPHRINKNQWAEHDAEIPMADRARTENKDRIYATLGGGMGGGPTARFGLVTGGSGLVGFFVPEEPADHIVYVVDRSGSMMAEFDIVRQKMIESISKLGKKQTFHVVFFSSGKPDENPPRRLVYASTDSKRGALKYLRRITPESTSGFTNPIPALIRAFEVLNKPPNNKPGKLIYLLTDGEFRDNEMVRKTAQNLNKGRDVHINTILIVYDAPEAKRVLKRIAEENKGKFKFVERNE